jgi:hypothetical protein
VVVCRDAISIICNTFAILSIFSGNPVYIIAMISGNPIYHTNVILSICSNFVVVCTEAIAAEDRGRIMEKLARSNRYLLDSGNICMQNEVGKKQFIIFIGEYR